jgi:protoporphyrinogen oxidase
MSKSIPFPATLKLELKKIAAQRGYPIVAEVLDRGQSEELVVRSQEEAQALVNVARIEMLDASLKYPFWNDDLPQYDQKHEDRFQDIQMGIFEKTIMYLGQSYKVTTTV